MTTTTVRTRANKTDAGNGSKVICRVSNVLRSPSPDPRRSGKGPSEPNQYNTNMSGNFVVENLMFILGGFVALFVGQAIYMEIEGVRKHRWRFLCGSHYFDCDENHEESVSATTSEFSSTERRSDAVSPGGAIQANLVTFLASIGMCAAFFMPWISIMGLGVSGTTIGKIGDGGQAAWLILVLAVISAALHLARPSRILHVITGISPFALLIYFVSNAPRDLGDHLFEALSVGAYLLLICGLCLIFAPVRNAK